MSVHLTLKCDRCNETEEQPQGLPTTKIKKTWINVSCESEIGHTQEPIAQQLDLCVHCRDYITAIIEDALEGRNPSNVTPKA